MMQRVMHPQVCAKVTATEAVAPSAPCLSTAPTDFVTVAPDPAGGDGARSVTCHTCWPEPPLPVSTTLPAGGVSVGKPGAVRDPTTAVSESAVPGLVTSLRSMRPSRWP